MDENQRINEEYRIAYKLKCCSMSLISLAILHLVLFDFFWILTDLCSALIVYFTYNNRTNLIAIFSLVNGIIGLIYSVIKGMYHISYLLPPFSMKDIRIDLLEASAVKVES